jgi:hypothetical protein
MTYSWQAAQSDSPEVSEQLRARLEQVADLLIPEADGMPAASAVGVARRQLDAVLRSRPDLLAPLTRALGSSIDIAWDEWLSRLHAEDPAAYQALTIVALAGYYGSDEVKRRLGYPGQTASRVRVEFPYADEGLLDIVLERGPTYREPAAD